MKNPLLAVAAMAIFGASGAYANGVLLTYAEDPGIQTSSLADTSYISFDNLSTGSNKNLAWAGVGTYDNAYILNADQYGGAGGTGKYIVQSTSLGGSNAVPTTTLTLNTPSAYFGLWWSAGDAANKLSFYNGSTLVASFTTASLVNVLPASYKGNPTPAFLGKDAGEKFAFFNVYGENGATWDSVVFTNTGSSGFESDNHTTRVDAWGQLPGESGAAPGVAFATVNGTTVTSVAAVPETGTWVMGFLALGAVTVMARRNSKAFAR
jgi:hypothetical protein